MTHPTARQILFIMAAKQAEIFGMDKLGHDLREAAEHLPNVDGAFPACLRLVTSLPDGSVRIGTTWFSLGAAIEQEASEAPAGASVQVVMPVPVDVMTDEPETTVTVKQNRRFTLSHALEPKVHK